MSEPHAAVEAAARDAYGKLVAWGARFARDVVAAEDALADALERALRTWPERGVPNNPEAWLLTTARNRMRDGEKHDGVRRRAEATLTQLYEELGGVDTVLDQRLELMLVCAHPAIDEAARAPLMLQVVLGLDATAVARAFMVSPAGMSKRLVRAKAKIKAAAIGFERPEPEVWPKRLGAVLDAIYAAYGRAWDLGCPVDAGVEALRAEALHLGRVVATATPSEPEALALRALMLYCEARASARTDSMGSFVPLDEQEVARWDAACVREAEALLRAASAHASVGRYQLEAAIQSAHVARLQEGVDNREEVRALYRLLHQHHPSMGAWLGLCAASARVDGPEAALQVLRAADAAAFFAHQPYWALRFELAQQAGAADEAVDCLNRAIALTAHPAVQRWLRQRRTEA